MLVLDASVTLAWLLDDEADAATHALFERVIAEGAIVPSLWRLEVANALLAAARRKRISFAVVDNSLADLAVLPIETDSETDARAWQETQKLARQHDLTMYDAAYLELALRLKCPLATLDKALQNAAAKHA